MGKYQVSLAAKGAKNQVRWVDAAIPVAAVGNKPSKGAFHIGPVPFSRENFLRLLFQYLGYPWSWGGGKRTATEHFVEAGGTRRTMEDCSGVISRALLAMGIVSGRVSFQQAKQGKVLWRKGESDEDALSALTKAW